MMGKIIKLLIGIAFILLGAYSIYLFWGDVFTLIRGSIGFIMILVGLLFLALVD